MYFSASTRQELIDIAQTHLEQQLPIRPDPVGGTCEYCQAHRLEGSCGFHRNISSFSSGWCRNVQTPPYTHTKRSAQASRPPPPGNRGVHFFFGATCLFFFYFRSEIKRNRALNRLALFGRWIWRWLWKGCVIGVYEAGQPQVQSQIGWGRTHCTATGTRRGPSRCLQGIGGGFLQAAADMAYATFSSSIIIIIKVCQTGGFRIPALHLYSHLKLVIFSHPANLPCSWITNCASTQKCFSTHVSRWVGHLSLAGEL